MSESPHAPLPVICDRCRAEGLAGDDPFAAFGDLLDFAPVPRRPRVGGWTPEVQRAFVAALAITGSPRQAAFAVGRAANGFEQLKKARGNASFLAACERAVALAEEKARHRLAAGLDALARADASADPAAAPNLPAPIAPTPPPRPSPRPTASACAPRPSTAPSTAPRSRSSTPAARSARAASTTIASPSITSRAAAARRRPKPAATGSPIRMRSASPAP